MTTSRLMLHLHSAGLPPLDILDTEPEFEPQRAALARLDAAEEAFDERERTRHAAHEKDLNEWAARAEAAALAGQEPPPGRPVWEETPGRAAFDREREAEVQRIRDAWQAHGREILDRLTMEASVERDAAQVAHDAASDALRAAEEKLKATGVRLRVLGNAAGTLPRPVRRPERVEDDGALNHPAGRFVPAVALGEIWQR